MGFKPRPPPPPPPQGAKLSTPGKKKRGFVEKTSKVISGPGILTRKSSVTTPNRPDGIKKSGSWKNPNGGEDERPKSLRRVRSSKSSIPPSPSPSRQSSFTASGSTAASTPRNSTKKTVFRHKVFQNGELLYEWDQNPKFVSIYYPTPNANFTAFCNIFSGYVASASSP